MLDQVGDGRRQVVVRVHQAGPARHDAVAIGVGIVAKGQVEPLAQADHAAHGVG